MFSAAAAQISTESGAIALDSRPRAIVLDVDAPPQSINKLVSEHWQSRGHRRERERRAVARALEGKPQPSPPWCVTFTRIGSHTLDSDNLAISFKAYRDEICDWLGVDDRDSDTVRFEYEQRKAQDQGPASDARRTQETGLSMLGTNRDSARVHGPDRDAHGIVAHRM